MRCMSRLLAQLGSDHLPLARPVVAVKLPPPVSTSNVSTRLLPNDWIADVAYFAGYHHAPEVGEGLDFAS